VSARGLLGRYLPPVALLVGLVGLWELWVAVDDTPSYLLAAPTDIWAAFSDNLDVLPDHLRATSIEAVLGLVIGAVAGVTVAVALHSIPLVRRVLYPLLVGSQTIPMIVLAPLLVLWFGFGYTPKVLVVVLIVFFPVAVSTAAGLETADRELIDLVRAMGGSRGQVLRHVLVPTAVPAFFSGLRIAAAYAVAGAVVGEWVGAENGLGIFITRSQASFRVDQVFVAVALIALLSMALFGLVHVAARLASPWMYVDLDQREGRIP
jgi:ABC-type nitrate/sulfonate/bicarbonate transport system permease component